ncbi:MAG: hypothetical protein IPO35_17550 [Uliginosibacterium sp.]|nr:hypothetical protein [Uliginosibacterium sp.]
MPRWAARLRETHRFFVIYGGRGSSKSWTIARDRLLLSSQQPLQGLCVRETQESLADSVHRLLANQIEEMGLPDGPCNAIGSSTPTARNHFRRHSHRPEQNQIGRRRRLVLG